MDDTWVERYLSFLGVGVGRGEPSFGALTAITAAHACVPFENVTSLLRKRDTPQGPVPDLDFEALLSNWERGRGGGVCYEIAGMIYQLLSALGYEVHPIVAEVAFTASHQAVVVSIDAGEFMVDCGNGAPLWSPIPLDEPHIIHEAGLGFRFSRDENGQFWQDHLIEGQARRFCGYDLAPAVEETRRESFRQHHRLPAESFVMQELRVYRSRGGDFLQLAGDTFTRHTPDGKQRRRLSGDEDYEELLAQEFGLPDLPVREGLQALRALQESAS